MAASDIVEHADDDILIDGLAATGSILEYLLRLIQVNKRLLCPLDVDAVLCVAAELDHPLQEFLYLHQGVPLSVISLSVEGVISTSFLSSERFGSVSAMLSCCDASKFSVIIELFQNIMLLRVHHSLQRAGKAEYTDQLQRPFFGFVL